ncbi:MAG: ATP-binding protein [Candidatus Paceibacterota bacterium]|jgi:SpoVK/Ycf46/Vps4 family AAA+-type ATPase
METIKTEAQEQGMIPSHKQNILLQNIEQIIEMSESSELSDVFFDQAKPYIDFVKDKFHLSDIATIFFAVFVNNNDSCYISVKKLADHFKCRKIRIMRYGESFLELERRRLVRCKRSDNEIGYRIPADVIYALHDGRDIEPKQISDLSQDDFFSRLNDLFLERKESEIRYDHLAIEMDELVNANLHLNVCQIVNKHRYTDREKILLLYICHAMVNEDEDYVSFYEMQLIFEFKDLLFIKKTLKHGTNPLIEDQWIENTRSDDFIDANYYQLTDKAKQELIGIDLSQRDAIQNGNNYVMHGTIGKKDLFFDAQVQEQIEQLTDLLMPENFESVQKRLSSNGMRNGFSCLFYGPPGTGKTECVYQIARKTGRNILTVDFSEIKSKWVGESEKNVKKLFDIYRNKVSSSDAAPIFLFNEADALLGTRLETLRSVDKMENALQNIILQEMENLNGIMIATTNLTKNLDEAFERRFIYKINFLKPHRDTKRKIWQAMLQSLPDAYAEELASRFDFSGGQIENIVRKITVELVLTGKEPSFEMIHEFCRNEQMNHFDRRPRIGFNSQAIIETAK